MRVSLSCVLKSGLLALLAAIATAVPVAAETRVDPRHVMFTASVDDAAVDENGVPLIAYYSLKIFAAGADAPLQEARLGKPAPEVDGTIRIEFVPLLISPLAPGVAYEAVVEAVGPFGNSDSERSAPFSFTPPRCDPWIAPGDIEVSAAVSSTTISVHAGEGCAWRAVSNNAWLTVTAGAAGSGSGAVTVTIAQNVEKNTRRGTLTIAGLTFRVNQRGDNKSNKDGKDGKDNKDKDSGSNAGDKVLPPVRLSPATAPPMIAPIVAPPL